MLMMVRQSEASGVTSSCANRMYRRNKLWLCAAAATFSTLPDGQAFHVARPPASRITQRHSLHIERSLPHIHLPCPSTTTVRHLSSQNSNDNGSGGVLSTIKNAAKSVAKSVLPSSWFQSEKEKQAAIERKRVKEEVSGGMSELLKDAPLPVRMMGKMMGPLVSSAMSTMAESMAEQQQTVQDYLTQATMYLETDESVIRVLGEPVQVGSPFSQSSSTSSINGQTTTRVEIGFPVSGSRSSGTAQLAATEAGIQRLVVQADGRQINVSLTSSKKRPKSSSGRNAEDDDVIEAEIVEKDTRR